MEISKNKENEIIKNGEVGVIIARFQVNKLHKGHIEMINHVVSNYKKIIILLGVSTIQNTKKNPLDFATRQFMLNELYPNIIILPIKDMRNNNTWSKQVDSIIATPFGEKNSVIFGSRDSFIPYYSGKYPVIELESSSYYNGTNIREEVAKETLSSSDFRAGQIYSVFNKRPVTYPTVDICAYNNKGQILMAKKPNEDLWRFVGGFVDRTDEDYEMAAKREFREETGGNCEIGEPRYILSQKVDDWRYRNGDDGIMTTLFIAEHKFGMASGSDDIVEVQWIDFNLFSNYDGVRTKVMPEHREMMTKLVNKVYSQNLIPNIGDRLPERTDNVIYTIE